MCKNCLTVAEKNREGPILLCFFFAFSAPKKLSFRILPIHLLNHNP